MSTNGNGRGSAGKGKAKRKRGQKFSALFLLGSDGEVYATCPMPSPPIRLAREADFIMGIRLNRRERDILLAMAHTDGVIEAAKVLAGILKPDA
jgi:hypothetical protein